VKGRNRGLSLTGEQGVQRLSDIKTFQPGRDNAGSPVSCNRFQGETWQRPCIRASREGILDFKTGNPRLCGFWVLRCRVDSSDCCSRRPGTYTPGTARLIWAYSPQERVVDSASHSSSRLSLDQPAPSSQAARAFPRSSRVVPRRAQLMLSHPTRMEQISRVEFSDRKSRLSRTRHLTFSNLGFPGPTWRSRGACSADLFELLIVPEPKKGNSREGRSTLCRGPVLRGEIGQNVDAGPIPQIVHAPSKMRADGTSSSQLVEFTADLCQR
jgi:hypothetical protein